MKNIIITKTPKIFLAIILTIGLFSANAQTNPSPTKYKNTFILKTAPFDLLIGRYILAGEFRLNKKSSLELNFVYDYLKQTDLIYGNVSDFGRYYYFAPRYKYFPKMGQYFIKEENQYQMNGFFLAAGLEIGQSPLLNGPDQSVFKYVSNEQDERSNFYGTNVDLGYSWISNRWNIEAFVGLTARQNSNARSSRLEGDDLVYDYAPLFSPLGRIGIRVGYVIF